MTVLSRAPQSAGEAIPGTAHSKAVKSRRRWETFGQGVLLAIGSAFALAPPIEGTMLVAPLLPGDPAASVGWVRAANARLIAPGPYAGSYVITGSLAALLLPALSHGTLLITARVAGCGATRPKDL